MTRKEFLDSLYRLLGDLPEEEKRAAIRYYEDYLAEAEEENEEDAVRGLGSPERIAAMIRADYYGTEFRQEECEGKDYPERYRKAAEHTGRSVKILLILLIAIAVIPASWGILLPVIGTVIGLLCACFGIFAGLVAGAGALMIAGIGMVIAAFYLTFHVLPAAFLVGGIGLILFVVGMIAVVGTVKLCMIVYPAMLRGIVNLCRRPFYGKAVH